MRKICMLLSVIMLAGLFCACGKGKEPAPAVTNEPEAMTTEAAAELTAAPAELTAAPAELTAAPAEPTEPEEADPSEAGTENASGPSSDLDIPVYNENDLIMRIPIWEDQCLNDEFSGVFMHEMELIFKEFPTDATRYMYNGNQYAVYDTDDGYRLFVIYDHMLDNDKLPLAARGFPILVKELHSYEEFASLKVGDSIDLVVGIDPVAGKVRDKIYRSGIVPRYIHSQAERGWPITSFHYLTDGVLKIEYDMDTPGELYIINIVYSPDYKMEGNNGKTVNYKLFDCDLPQP